MCPLILESLASGVETLECVAVEGMLDYGSVEGPIPEQRPDLAREARFNLGDLT